MAEWINSNWIYVLFGVAAAAKILNLITKHWSDHAGVVKVCLFLVDLLDIVKTTPKPGTAKPRIDIKPGTMLLALLLSVSIAGCTTTAGGEKKFDQCQAMKIAYDSHIVAQGASGIVCNMLQGEKREKCLKQREKVSAAANAVLSIADGIIKACKL